MSDRPGIPLTPALIELDAPEFKEIASWRFSDTFVSRLLTHDIPQRAVFGNGLIWGYRDPGGLLVGFGTIDVCDDYKSYTNGQMHTYIPLLGVNETMQGKGFGHSIVKHLIAEAAFARQRAAGCHEVLFLDVYTENGRAISLYEKCGFRSITTEPIPDPDESGRPYIVMAKRVAISFTLRPID